MIRPIFGRLAQLLNLEQLCGDITDATEQAEIFAALQTGKDCLAELQRQVSAEDVERLMDETSELVEVQVRGCHLYRCRTGFAGERISSTDVVLSLRRLFTSGQSEIDAMLAGSVGGEVDLLDEDEIEAELAELVGGGAKTAASAGKNEAKDEKDVLPEAPTGAILPVAPSGALEAAAAAATAGTADKQKEKKKRIAVAS